MIKSNQKSSLFLAQERLRFLAEAGKMLTSSLDYDATLASVAYYAVSTITDLCDIFLFEKNHKTLRRVVVIDSDPVKNEIVKQFYKYPPNPKGTEGSYYVARTGKSILKSPITDEWLQSITTDFHELRTVKSI